MNNQSYPNRFGTLGPPPRLFRTPIFFQRVLELTAYLSMVLEVPLLLREPERGLLLLPGFALVICSFHYQSVMQRPCLLAAVTFLGTLLAGLGVSVEPAFVSPLHMLVLSVLTRTAPFLTWPLAIGSAFSAEFIYLGAKSGWAFTPALSLALLPSNTLDLAGKLILAIAAKNWQDLYQAVRKSAVELSAVTGSSGDLIAILDRKGALRSVNAACRNMLGYEPEEITGREAVYPFGQIGEAKVIEALIDAGQPAYSILKQAHCKDGTAVWLEWNVEPIPELDALLCVGRDVTRRGQPPSDLL